MAVLDLYVDPLISGNVVNKLLPAIRSQGAPILSFFQTFEKAATDNDGSKWRLFKNLDPNLIPLQICIGGDGFTGFTSASLGLYEPNLGAALQAGCFLNAASLVAAAASLNPKTAADAMVAVDIAAYYKRLYEYAGHTITNRRDGYDFVLTGTTVGAVAGTVSVLMLAAQG